MKLKYTALLSTCFLLASLSISQVQAEDDLAQESDPIDNPDQLQSLPLLQSLRNIDTEYQLQAPYVQELNNRYKVRTLFVESKDLPMVDIQLTFNAGSARDEEIQKGLFGLSSMAAKLIREGTDRYTAQEVADVFDQTGAHFSAQAYRDMFIVRLRVLSDPDKLEPALAMMLEILKHASFQKQSISLTVSNTNVGQKQLQENPSRLRDIRFYRTVYGTHPYAYPVTGTIGGTRSVTPEHLKKFRDQFLVAQNMNIAITGNLTSKEAQKLSERIAGILKQGSSAQRLPYAELKNDIEVVHIPYKSSQAHVIFGHIGPSRSTPDKLALDVANKMFGGNGFNAVLMQELRIKRGYTYGAYSSMSFTQAPGVFSFSYSTRQDQLLDSIQVAHQALVNFVNQPIDQKRMKVTKAGMLRAFPNHYNNNATINAQLGSIGFYGEPQDYLRTYPERLKNISTQDVENAVRKHWHPDRLTVIVVSQKLDKEALKAALKQNLPTVNDSQNTGTAP
ncbi:pitrilysin family protein [Acinetobacter sp. ANC 7454]|uniref:M16 family metallopeptidase n=1 Tax=Acinetobacter thermotolerans TaxID=3151487 RepID=UPI00325C2E6C